MDSHAPRHPAVYLRVTQEKSTFQCRMGLVDWPGGSVKPGELSGRMAETQGAEEDKPTRSQIGEQARPQRQSLSQNPGFLMCRRVLSKR